MLHKLQQFLKSSKYWKKYHELFNPILIVNFFLD